MKNILQTIFLVLLFMSIAACQVEIEAEPTPGSEDSNIPNPAIVTDGSVDGTTSNPVTVVDSVSLNKTEATIPQAAEIDVSLATIKISSPLINVQLLMNLLNEKTEFVIEYSGAAPRKITKPTDLPDKKVPTEKEISTLVNDAVAKNDSAKKAKQDSLGRNSYSKEDADYNKAMAKLNSAQRLFSRKRYADALREIDGAITAAPNIALSHSVKGSIHYMLKQNLEAKSSWERALELDPAQDNVRAILLRMY